MYGENPFLVINDKLFLPSCQSQILIFRKFHLFVMRGSLWQRPPGNTYGQTESPGSTTAEAAEFLSQSPRKGYPLLLLPYWTNISELERKLLRILSVENSKKNHFCQHISDVKLRLLNELKSSTQISLPSPINQQPTHP